MRPKDWKEVALAREAALEVLRHNNQGPFHGLPRTAGWGYPEPYTRDLLISILGIAVSGDQKLMESTRHVLITLAKNQSVLGHIPSLVHDKENRGSSDSTPLYLLGVSIFRTVTGEQDFLQDSVQKALTWMEYQSPAARFLVAQLPTSDWRDEQWVLGYGLYVNTLVYSYLRLFKQHERAESLRKEMVRFTITGGHMHRHVHEGLVVKHKPYYAFWSYKIYSSERFDLLGNCLAMLSGIASPARAGQIVSWIEKECADMRERGELGLDLPPNLFPFMKPGDPDWRERYSEYNKPGEYHNGGIWPFICGFYVAALVGAKKYRLAGEKLMVLTRAIRASSTGRGDFGFNEWLKAADGKPAGQDWQSWSAALYLYAVKCIEEKRTPFFEEMRDHPD
jgi:hypothetical protein